MSDTLFTPEVATRIATRRAARRGFLRNAGIVGLGAIGAAHLTTPGVFAQGSNPADPSDADIFNFALNLEYLEAEFYLQAAFGRNLGAADIGANPGAVTGGRPVPFATAAIRQYAREIAADEEAHVRFIRRTLGSAAVARPAINIDGGTATNPGAFTLAARAAGVVGSNGVFDPYADENSFLLAAFIFEDVGVTAYKGAARFIDNRDFVEAAAGLLAVEAYHASQIRTVLFARGLSAPTNLISNARDTLDRSADEDQGITDANGEANIVPTDADGLAFSRTAADVLNIVYLNAAEVSAGGFLPNGANGAIRTSSAFA